MINYTELLPGRFGWMVALKCDPYQHQSIALYGEWARAEWEVLSTLIKPGDVVIDVGANIGSRAIPFGCQVGAAGRVYAIEPQRLCYLCLAANVALNSLGMVVFPLHAAAGSEPGVIECPMIDPTRPNNIGGLRLKYQMDTNEVHTIGREEVPQITVDSLNVDRCALIKIDVEGMESDVLAGAVNVVEQHQPMIWCEFLPHDQHKPTSEAICAVLKNFRYRAWRVITPVYSPANVRRCTINPYEAQADHNLVAIPSGVEPPPWIIEAKCEQFV